MGEIEAFKTYLIREEKSKATIEKYIRDVEKFLTFLKGGEISKELVIHYKEHLITLYKAKSVNSMLAALNQFLHWLELPQFCVKQLKIQHPIFRSEEKELTKAEYIRLVQTARANGNAIDRSNIWRCMKALHFAANVLEQKIFPHNLRHLFVRIFYEVQKDIAKLADILGHSSIDTTRIYIISTGKDHQRQLDAIGLVV